MLFRPARTAFDKAGNTEPVIPAVNLTALQRLLVVPADLGQRLFENRTKIPGVELRRRLVVDEPACVERHFAAGDQVAAANLDRIDAEVCRSHVNKPLPKEICLDPA